MQTWKITAVGSTAAIRHGTAQDMTAAWGQAARAVIDGLAAGEFDRCAIIIADNPPALLFAGHTGNGRLNLPEARAALQRLAVAITGWPFL